MSYTIYASRREESGKKIFSAAAGREEWEMLETTLKTPSDQALEWTAMEILEYPSLEMFKREMDLAIQEMV